MRLTGCFGAAKKLDAPIPPALPSHGAEESEGPELAGPRTALDQDSIAQGQQTGQHIQTEPRLGERWITQTSAGSPSCFCKDQRRVLAGGSIVLPFVSCLAPSASVPRGTISSFPTSIRSHWGTAFAQILTF